MQPATTDICQRLYRKTNRKVVHNSVCLTLFCLIQLLDYHMCVVYLTV